MSRQYLVTHTIESAHAEEIFSLAVTPNAIVSASGESALQIYSTLKSSFPLIQVLPAAHKLGCHHVCASSDGSRLVSIGFESDIKIWRRSKTSSEEGDEQWEEEGQLVDGIQPGEIWAPALSDDGKHLAITTRDGQVKVWDLDIDQKPMISVYETRGSFGLCIDISSVASMTATGHVSGSVYVFDNKTGKLQHSLPSLHAPVRAVRFSPLSTLIAAGGDSRVIALFDAKSGEQIASLSGHQSWVTCLAWSNTGEWLGSGEWNGRARVWDVKQRECVSVLSDAVGSDGRGAGVGSCIWALTWLPRVEGRRGEGFAMAGSSKGISFYREAASS